MSTMTLMLLGLAALAALLFFALIIGVVMLTTGKKPTSSQPTPQIVAEVKPQAAPPPTPEDLLHAAFKGVKDYAARKSAIDIGQRLADYEANQMADAIAQGVQRRPDGSAPKE